MAKISAQYISVIIEQLENKEGMILFLDFEKAFDSLECDYFFKVLDIKFILSTRTSQAVLLTMVTPQNFLLYKEELDRDALFQDCSLFLW